MTVHEDSPRPKLDPKALLEQHGVTDFRALYFKFHQADAEIMRSHGLDHKNRLLITNQIYQAICDVQLAGIEEGEKAWIQEIKWLWNHHAISSALWRYQDPQEALQYATTALTHLSEDTDNKITRLFFLLLSERIDEARTWMATIDNDEEKDTADFIMRSYQAGWREDV